MIRHQVRAGGAVESDGQKIGMRHGSVEGVDRLAGEHRSPALDGAGNHQRNTGAEFPFEPLHGDQTRLQVAGVKAGFKQQQVRAAFEQTIGLHIVAVAQLAEADVGAQRERLSGGAHRARHEARLRCGGKFVSRLAGQLRGERAQFVRLLSDPEFRQHDRRALETVGLQDIRACVQISAMDLENPFRTCSAQLLKAVIKRRAAKIGRRGTVRLQHGTHRPVDHEDTGGEGIVETLAAQIIHGSELPL